MTNHDEHVACGFGIRPPETPRSTGQWLREARKRAGLSMGDLARVLKVSVVSVSDLEHNRVPHEIVVET